ncbi:unnamed protein product, partial [Mycena citricolor]
RAGAIPHGQYRRLDVGLGLNTHNLVTDMKPKWKRDRPQRGLDTARTLSSDHLILTTICAFTTHADGPSRIFFVRAETVTFRAAQAAKDACRISEQTYSTVPLRLSPEHRRQTPSHSLRRGRTPRTRRGSCPHPPARERPC